MNQSDLTRIYGKENIKANIYGVPKKMTTIVSAHHIEVSQ